MTSRTAERDDGGQHGRRDSTQDECCRRRHAEVGGDRHALSILTTSRRCNGARRRRERVPALSKRADGFRPRMQRETGARPFSAEPHTLAGYHQVVKYDQG